MDNGSRIRLVGRPEVPAEMLDRDSTRIARPLRQIKVCLFFSQWRPPTGLTIEVIIMVDVIQRIAGRSSLS
jgi:hypothetical protein